jgi:hypothetical protein
MDGLYVSAVVYAVTSMRALESNSIDELPRRANQNGIALVSFLYWLKLTTMDEEGKTVFSEPAGVSLHVRICMHQIRDTEGAKDPLHIVKRLPEYGDDPLKIKGHVQGICGDWIKGDLGIESRLQNKEMILQKYKDFQSWFSVIAPR